MALIKLGAIVNVASGKLNGVVYSHNRNGSYARTFAIPVNPRTPSQTRVRSNLDTLATQWKGLTDGQRGGWTVLGSQIIRTNPVGDSYDLTGLQAYVSVNQKRLEAGQARVDTAPALGSIDDITGATVVATPSVTPGNRILTISGTPAIGIGDRIELFVTGPLSPGRKFVKPSQYKFMQYLTTWTAAQSFLTAWEAIFGPFDAPKAGQKLGVKIVPVNENFIAGTPIELLVTVGAAVP